jgi:hypothetical protein
LVNDIAFVDWNLDKVHQIELGAAGVPVVPTTWVAPGDAWEPPALAEFVVKPSVSAGGRGSARYAPGDAAALCHVRGLQAAGQTVMVQDYMAAVDTDGETDIIFFGGCFSHAVRKKPFLTAGQAVAERPWEQMAWEGQVVPHRRELDVAKSTVGVIRARMGAWPAYARVDLVNGPIGSPLVLEVEMIDPLLSLGMDPEAAGRLASAVLRH